MTPWRFPNEEEGDGEPLRAEHIERLRRYMERFPTWENPLYRYNLTQDPYFHPIRAYREACQIVEEAWPFPSS